MNTEALFTCRSFALFRKRGFIFIDYKALHAFAPDYLSKMLIVMNL